MAEAQLFRSFWMGGFESATHISNKGERLDMIAGVQHDLQAASDYALMKTMNMRTVRDAVRWHLVDHCCSYDFRSFEPMLLAALRGGMQVIWDLCHYGFPDGLSPLSATFVDRFARYSGAVAKFVREHSDEVPFYSPVNEINFYAWGASRDFMFPFAHGRDNELKQQLVRAAIASVEAIWDVDPRARITYPEPVIRVFPSKSHPELAQEAADYTRSQYDAWDMISGRTHPELGGHPKYLDIPGANFYFSNQWELKGHGRLKWEENPRDNRWVPFSEMLASIWERYGRPLYVGETSHFGVGRGPWIREIAEEVRRALDRNIPVEGICIYPIIDRYDWFDRNHWHKSGLWDLEQEPDGTLRRVLDSEYGQALRESQALLGR